jgi:hypothetical protein
MDIISNIGKKHSGRRQANKTHVSCAEWATNRMWGRLRDLGKRTMSDEFDGLDATEKAGIGTALNRCRALATKIANELRNKEPEHFVDELSLADIHASLERAAWVLEQKTAKGLQERSRQRHR